MTLQDSASELVSCGSRDSSALVFIENSLKIQSHPAPEQAAFRTFARTFTIEVLRGELGKQVGVALYVVAMAATIVGVDFAFFKNRFLERLMVNIGIVLVFVAFYLRFFRRT